MSKRNEGLFYFVGPMNPVTRKFRKFLSDNHRMNFETSNAEEIIQGANQSGRTLVFFSDAKFAMSYLANNPFRGAEIKLVLLIEKDGFYKKEIMKQLKDLRLHFYSPESVPQLVQDIKNYLAGKEVVNSEELEFSACLTEKKRA